MATNIEKLTHSRMRKVGFFNMLAIDYPHDINKIRLFSLKECNMDDT